MRKGQIKSVIPIIDSLDDKDRSIFYIVSRASIDLRTTLPVFSPIFEKTLHRTLKIANDKGNIHATLEHLLLSLTQDREALAILKACRCNVSRLRRNLTEYIDGLERVTSEEVDAKPTSGFQRVVQRAVIHVQSAGREEVGGREALVALMAERESHAAHYLQAQGITRYDLVSAIENERNEIQQYPLQQAIKKSIGESIEDAPQFQTTKGRIRYQEASATSRISERKAAVIERCKELQRRCATRSNEQHELHVLVENYAKALSNLRKDRGAYNLFLTGMEIETLLRVKSEIPTDDDRNLPIDADLLFAVRSLIVAHAGLITLFPDVRQATQEIDQYRTLSGPMDALRDRLLDPILDKLAASDGILDSKTQQLTDEIRKLNKQETKSGLAPSEGTTAIKHSWLRGALGSIGQFLLQQTKESAKVARDEAIKEGVKNQVALRQSILEFIFDAKNLLSSIAEKLPAAFGWITSLLTLLGLK